MPEKITVGADGALVVPDEPLIPYIQGDGTGVDIWPATQRVLDAAVARHGRRIAWVEVLAGQRAYDETGEWLPAETVAAFEEQVGGREGAVAAAVGGGMRSLGVAVREVLGVYVCRRAVGWF